MSASSTRKQWAAVATGCSKTAEPKLDDGEFCEVKLLPLQTFRTRLREGQLTDAAIAYLALDYLGLL